MTVPPDNRQTIHEIPGEPLCFNADSDVWGAPPYRIELEPFDCNGTCTCPDFGRKLKELRKGERSNETHFCCKHLRRAWIYFGRKMAREIAAMADEQLKKAERFGGGNPNRRFRDARYERKLYADG